MLAYPYRLHYPDAPTPFVIAGVMCASSDRAAIVCVAFMRRLLEPLA